MSTDLSPATAVADEPAGRPAAAPPANKPVWQLLLGAVVVVAVLWALGGWAVPFVIFAIVLMVVVHELGHFLTARWTGMKASEFFVGFGPRLWSKRFGETEFGLKGIVAGGYVRILGMTTNEEIAAGDEARSFRQATFPRRVLVASAGSLMHLIMALILAWVSLFFFGQVTSTPTEISGFTHWHGVAATPAQMAGLHKGDVVVRVNGRSVNSLGAFEHVVGHSIGVPLQLTVHRRGHTVHLTATPVNGQTVLVATKSAKGVTTYVPASTRRVGYIGVYLSPHPVTTPVSFVQSVPASFALVGSYIAKVADGTWQIFSPSGLSRIVHADVSSRAATSPSFINYRPTSIYGIAHVAIQVAYQHPAQLLTLFMLINLGVGFINMLPMLPLDGGYVAIAIYERIRTRRGQPNYHADVNKFTPLVVVFLAVLLVIFLSSLYFDIAHPLHL